MFKGIHVNNLREEERRGAMTNVVDFFQVGWVFCQGANAKFFTPAVQDLENLLVPSIVPLTKFSKTANI